jgi:hypothetical protein
MSNTCLSFIMPLRPVSLVWSMLQAPGLAGVALFAASAVGAAAAVANAKTREIVVIGFLLIALSFVVRY